MTFSTSPRHFKIERRRRASSGPKSTPIMDGPVEHLYMDC